jgi:hypothetical protein
VSLLESGAVRAGVFFAAAFALATLLGGATGDLRLGAATGVAAGLLMAVFGVLFVRPADDGAE